MTRPLESLPGTPTNSEGDDSQTTVNQAIRVISNNLGQELAVALEGKDKTNERLRTLVVEPINALPLEKRTVRGRVRTGEEIALAIPDQEAFLREIDLMQEATFFELNPIGQLLMMDGCKEAYGLNEDFHEAKTRQTRLVYRREDGAVRVMEGSEYFTADENGMPILSDAAKKIPPESILMRKGLPTLERDIRGQVHTGEYARMNGGRFENINSTWVECKSRIFSKTLHACWIKGRLVSFKKRDASPEDKLGSRGVLTVNLTFEA